LLDHLVNGIPAEIVAGSQWKRGFAQECKTRDEIVYQEPDGGVVASLCYGEAVGGLSYVIIGAFASPEAAEAYYQLILGRTRTLDGAEERDSVGNFTFPKPNAFGGGTYGSDAIFLKDNLFIQVSVPRFSSTSGEPLNPMARAVLRAVDDALATYQG